MVDVSGIVVSTVASQEEGPGFEPADWPQLFSVYVWMLGFPHKDMQV